MNQMKGSKRCCCIVGCKSTEGKNPELQFYKFPGRSYEEERKKKWIAAVRRLRLDNNLYRKSKMCMLNLYLKYVEIEKKKLNMSLSYDKYNKIK